MKPFLRVFRAAVLTVAVTLPVAAQEKAAPPPDGGDGATLPEDYSCMFCHGADGTLAELEENKHLIVTPEHLADDVHWQKGIRCHDCHGGHPTLEDFVDHRKDDSYRGPFTPADIPDLCGRCHSDVVYMRKFRPSPRTDQAIEYWTSGHGQRLKALAESGDPSEAKVATCVSCHGRHGIRPVNDMDSPVYPTRLAETCATCHSDEEVMAGREYQGRALGHSQFAEWKQSVHGKAMLEKGDLSAPTCNDCHGNHGAVPPGAASVANACGTCHGKVAKLFAETSMRHRFEEVGLPGCATCHGNHQTLSPTDEMLGMEESAVCNKCHKPGGESKYGATLVGADAARSMREGLEDLKERIARAEEAIQEAERLGMPVSGPRYDLRKALDALTNARSMIHTFASAPVNAALKEGTDVTDEVQESARKALADHWYRRVWLAGSLVPIFLVSVLLFLYIRSLPMPEKPVKD